MTLKDSRNATSLPGSASGLTPCAVPDGPMIAQSGQVHAHASLSAKQAKEQGLLTSGTFGLISITSLSSVALRSSLVNRLQAKMASHGSTLYTLTWKERVTPQQLSIYALRASVPRTKGKDCIGWATPTTRAHRDTGNLQNSFSEGRKEAQRHFVSSDVAAHFWSSWEANKGADEEIRVIPANYGTFAYGVAGRVGQLRAYGNAIVAPVAEAFISAYLESAQ